MLKMAIIFCVEKILYLFMTRKIIHKDEVVEFFHRHVVPIYFDFEKDGEHKSFIVTSFLLSVYDQWFLVTAGHCIDDIERINNLGFKLVKCRLVDSMGYGAEHMLPLPFDWEASKATKMCYDEKYDYGLIFLNRQEIELLKTNKVLPMNEDAWYSQPSAPEFFALIGVPAELSDSSADIAQITTTWHVVEQLIERPKCFEPTNAPTFWGKIRLTDGINSIVGMSGGPIFSFKHDNEGQLRYWLHAVQSRWNRSERVVAACLMQPMGIFLKEVMEGKHREKYS